METTNAKPKTITRPADSACPACSCRRAVAVPGHAQLYRCFKCDAIYGTLYLGESYGIVKPFFSQAEVPADRQRYFDFTTLGSNGIGRRHGWYDLATGLITQVG